MIPKRTPVPLKVIEAKARLNGPILVATPVSGFLFPRTLSFDGSIFRIAYNSPVVGFVANPLAPVTTSPDRVIVTLEILPALFGFMIYSLSVFVELE